MIKISLRFLMISIAAIAILLAIFKFIVYIDPFYGLGTVYSEAYDESRFATIRIGASMSDVKSIIGIPIRKMIGTDNIEIWAYSVQSHHTANYWRRWVIFENGKVMLVLRDFFTE